MKGKEIVLEITRNPAGIRSNVKKKLNKTWPRERAQARLVQRRERGSTTQHVYFCLPACRDDLDFLNCAAALVIFSAAEAGQSLGHGKLAKVGSENAFKHYFQR